MIVVQSLHKCTTRYMYMVDRDWLCALDPRNGSKVNESKTWLVMKGEAESTARGLLFKDSSIKITKSA